MKKGFKALLVSVLTSSMLFAKDGYNTKDQNNQKLHLDSMTDYYLNLSVLEPIIKRSRNPPTT